MINNTVCYNVHANYCLILSLERFQDLDTNATECQVVTNGRRSIEQGIKNARAMAFAWPYDRIHRQHFLRSESDAKKDQPEYIHG